MNDAPLIRSIRDEEWRERWVFDGLGLCLLSCGASSFHNTLVVLLLRLRQQLSMSAATVFFSTLFPGAVLLHQFSADVPEELSWCWGTLSHVCPLCCRAVTHACLYIHRLDLSQPLPHYKHVGIPTRAESGTDGTHSMSPRPDIHRVPSVAELLSILWGSGWDKSSRWIRWGNESRWCGVEYWSDYLNDILWHRSLSQQKKIHIYPYFIFRRQILFFCLRWHI